jgi:hypothetical protein
MKKAPSCENLHSMFAAKELSNTFLLQRASVSRRRSSYASEWWTCHARYAGPGEAGPRAHGAERLLLTALDASDVHTEPDIVLQSVPQNVVAFTLDGAPVQVFLNAYTHLPTAMDYSGPLPIPATGAFLVT